MKNELIVLLNTLNLIETKGESTKRMSQCMQYLETLIQKCEVNTNEPNTVSE
jgi:hypothetical protein